MISNRNKGFFLAGALSALFIFSIISCAAFSMLYLCQIQDRRSNESLSREREREEQLASVPVITESSVKND